MLLNEGYAGGGHGMMSGKGPVLHPAASWYLHKGRLLRKTAPE